MHFTLNNCLKTSFNWLLPKKCLLCLSLLSDTCSNPCCVTCQALLPYQIYACNLCGRGLYSSADYCGRCLHSPRIYDGCFCAFRYEPPIDKWVRLFKYGEQPELAKPLAQLMVQELIENQIDLPELLVPVPIHRSKLRQRGYNQALLLTKAISKQLDIPFFNNLVVKHKPTEPQASLSFKDRNKNIRGSLSLTQAIPAKHIAIIDDVITTGATVDEMAKVCKGNGQMQVWGVAHTI